TSPATAVKIQSPPAPIPNVFEERRRLSESGPAAAGVPVAPTPKGSDVARVTETPSPTRPKKSGALTCFLVLFALLVAGAGAHRRPGAHRRGARPSFRRLVLRSRELCRARR